LLWLIPSEVDGNGFGTSVTISGDKIVVGAYLDYYTARGTTGSAYVFKRVGRARPLDGQ